jgi:transposase
MVKGGQSLTAVSKILGIAEQTLHNWVKADIEGQLQGPDSEPVNPSRWRSRDYAPNWRA